MSKINNISVIGAGLMGHGIAQVFAVKGYRVVLMDMQKGILDTAINNIRSNLTLMADNNIIEHEDIESSIQNIHTTTDMKESAGEADFIVEAILENLELKQETFKELDNLCSSETILATNTSVISITEIAEKSINRDRIVGTHFWNPPYLIPLVEVIRGRDTSDNTMNDTINLLEKVGKHPVRVNKDVPGFVGNRLQHALWREAISIVEKGIADASTVDECIKYGFGLRLPVLGPLENTDMVGTDLIYSIHNYILKHLENSPEPSILLKNAVENGHLGFKTNEGLQKWSPEEVKESRKRLQEYLLKVTRK